MPAPGYADALMRELASRVAAYRNRRLLSIYFGGGTPTMLPDMQLSEVVDEIARTCGDAAEITLEANPEHVTKERAAAWKSIGFTRISLGIQSFDDEMLAFLGRKHTAKMALDAVSALQSAGFGEISIDLIYGAHIGNDAPNAHAGRRERSQSRRNVLNAWKQTLAAARSLAPAHVSCYELTLEPHTPLWTAAKHGDRIVEDDETIAEMMSMIPNKLGMKAYEVSNYARDGYLSAHNVSCWAGLPYLGIGAGAHSLCIDLPKIRRRANTHNIRDYLESKGIAEPGFAETLTPQMHLAERLICAARTRFAWSPLRIAQSINADLTPYIRPILDAVRKGWLALSPAPSCASTGPAAPEMLSPGDICRTTADGIRLNNLLTQTLFNKIPY